ncbi:hypothetical protein J31TS4_31580 [Paenibacillus sp. J31TS4]|nr:hypothetical protein J31TS4_31580 [Paenibacillus sp. J31TS4]
MSVAFIVTEAFNVHNLLIFSHFIRSSLMLLDPDCGGLKEEKEAGMLVRPLGRRKAARRDGGLAAERRGAGEGTERAPRGAAAPTCRRGAERAGQGRSRAPG